MYKGLVTKCSICNFWWTVRIFCIKMLGTLGVKRRYRWQVTAWGYACVPRLTRIATRKKMLTNSKLKFSRKEFTCIYCLTGPEKYHGEGLEKVVLWVMPSNIDISGSEKNKNNINFTRTYAVFRTSLNSAFFIYFFMLVLSSLSLCYQCFAVFFAVGGKLN